MTCKIVPLLLVFIIIMFLSRSKNIVGGNFLKQIEENKFMRKKVMCSNDDNIMKLSYNKKSCIFVDIYNNYTQDKIKQYLKKKYLNVYDNITDNIINLYCKLYMPLHIVIEDKEYLEGLLDNLFNILISINENFITLDYFSLHSIYITNPEKWYKLYKKHRTLYKTYSKKSYDISIKNFFIATINPVHSNLYNRLYYFIKKQINNDKELINKISNTVEKEKLENKTFSKFYTINKDVIKQKLLFDNFDNLDKNTNEIDYGSISNKLIKITDYIIKNDPRKINNFSNDLVLFKETINKKNYNVLFEVFNKELLNNQYIYNQICDNPFFKKNILSCPSKIV